LWDERQFKPSPGGKVWDVATGNAVCSFSGGADRVVFSPDGERLAGVSGKSVTVWDAGTGRERRSWNAREGTMRDLAFSPDGRLLATAANWYESKKSRNVGEITFWDAQSGTFGPAGKTITMEFEGSCVVFSPDGRRLAVTGYFNRILDAQAGTELASFSGNAIPAFGPDGRRIASGSTKGEVAVWDTVSGNSLFSHKGHTASVTAVAFSPDGKRLASASTDGTVRLWDVASGEEVYVLHAHAGALNGVAFSRDGRRLVAVGVEAVVWDASP
jgi:WD40 repeat protein